MRVPAWPRSAQHRDYATVLGPMLPLALCAAARGLGGGHLEDAFPLTDVTATPVHQCSPELRILTPHRPVCKDLGWTRDRRAPPKEATHLTMSACPMQRLWPPHTQTRPPRMEAATACPSTFWAIQSLTLQLRTHLLPTQQ